MKMSDKCPINFQILPSITVIHIGKTRWAFTRPNFAKEYACYIPILPALKLFFCAKLKGNEL